MLQEEFVVWKTCLRGKRLKELNILCLAKRKIRGGLFIVYKCLQGERFLLVRELFSRQRHNKSQGLEAKTKQIQTGTKAPNLTEPNELLKQFTKGMWWIPPHLKTLNVDFLPKRCVLPQPHSLSRAEREGFMKSTGLCFAGTNYMLTLGPEIFAVIWILFWLGPSRGDRVSEGVWDRKEDKYKQTSPQNPARFQAEFPEPAVREKQ